MNTYRYKTDNIMKNINKIVKLVNVDDDVRCCLVVDVDAVDDVVVDDVDDDDIENMEDDIDIDVVKTFDFKFKVLWTIIV